MALQLKASLNGLAALKKLGVSALVVDALTAELVEVKLTAKAFLFQKGAYLSQVAVTLDQLQKLNAGTLGQIEKMKLVTEINKTLNALMGDQGGSASGSFSSGGSGMQQLPKLANVHADVAINATLAAKPAEPLVTLGDLEPTQLVSTANASAELMAKMKTAMKSKVSLQLDDTEMPAQAWASFDKAKMHTATPVKLRDAKQMYQPVYGTSSGSRYFLVAANQDLRIAARLEAGTLSLRIEGPTWEKHTTSIQSAGFSNVDVNKGYASLHLAVGADATVARKTLGALLMGLGIELETPMPNMKLLQA